jgi:transposase
MGSVFYILRNGRKYAYMSTSRRVPGKKNPVTDKVYLGRVDPETGEIIPKESRARPKEEYAKRYGPVCVLDQVQRDMRILDDLRSVYPDLADNVMAAAMAQVIEPGPFDSVHYVVEATAIREMLCLRGGLSPSAMSDLSQRLGQAPTTMDQFFSLRLSASDSDSYALDLTSISTFGHVGGWGEWGHNRDEEKLRQVNLAMITDAEGIPMMFDLLPGSAADCAVMKELIDRANDLGRRGTRAVMDRGFDTAENLHFLLTSGTPFVMPSDEKAEPVKKLVTRAVADLRDGMTIASFEGSTYKYVEYELGVVRSEEDSCEPEFEYVIAVPRNEKGSAETNQAFDRSLRLKAFVVYDPELAAREFQTLGSKLTDAERRLGNKKFRDPKKKFDELPADVRRCLEWRLEDGLMILSRKQNALTFADNRNGLFVMMASDGTTWEQMMSAYSTRNQVEEAFNVYKNDTGAGRLRTADAERAHGRLFIKFVALMMRVRMINILRAHEKEVLDGRARKDGVSAMTLTDAMMSLNTLMAIGTTGDWRLTAVTKANRELFRLFGLEEPKGGKVVLGSRSDR